MKLEENLINLKQEEKRYFDTYRNKRTSSEKAQHLEEMALILREIEKIENYGLYQTKKSNKKTRKKNKSF